MTMPSMKPPLTHLQRAADILADMQELRIDLTSGDPTQINTHLVAMMDAGGEAMADLFVAATMWGAPKARRRAVRA